MLYELEGIFKVVVSTKNQDRNGVIPHSKILACLLKQLLNKKSTEHGYFLAVTKLKSVGKGELDESSTHIIFPVTFYCRHFLPMKGEIMLGVVYTVHRLGVFLKWGPMNFIYLSAQKMPNYYYVGGENPLFFRDEGSRIERGVVIRFVVFAVRWIKKKQDIEREFTILASLEGNCLGPVSLAGSDELDL